MNSEKKTQELSDLMVVCSVKNCQRKIKISDAKNIQEHYYCPQCATIIFKQLLFLITLKFF